MEQLFIFLHLDPIVSLLVLSSGFFAKTYLTFGVFSKLSNAHKTFISGSVFTGIYAAILFETGKFPADMIPVFFISFAVTTSIYELLVAPFMEFIKRVTGQKEQP